MVRLELGIALLTLLSWACSADASRAAGSSSSSVTSASASAPTQASPSAPARPPGPLTAARILEVGKAVKVGDPWASTERRMIAELGPSTRELVGLGHVWMVPGHDECTYFIIKRSDDKVSELVAPGTHPRSDRREFEECFYYVDETPPDKDPSGPGPDPARVYSVKEVLAGLEATRSKWVAGPIRMRGETVSVVRSGPSKDNFTNASVLLADEQDKTIRMAAQVDQNVADAPRDGEKAVITVEGKLDGHAGWIAHARIAR